MHTFFFTKMYGEIWHFCIQGGIFKWAATFKKKNSACGTTLLLDLNKSLSNDQSDCSILSRDDKFI